MKSYLLVFIFTFVLSGAAQAEGPICDYKPVCIKQTE